MRYHKNASVRFVLGSVMTTSKLALADHEVLSKVYPKGIKWDIDIPRITVSRMADEAFARFESLPFLSFQGKTLTYGETNNLVRRAAKGLQEMGVRRGTKVGTYLPNTPYSIIMLLAILKAGGTVTTFDPTYPKEQLRDFVKASHTSMLVTLDLKDLHDRALELKLDGTLKHVIRCDLADALPAIKGFGFNFASLLGAGSRLPGHGRTKSDKTKSLIAPDKRGSHFAVNFRDLIDNDGKVAPAETAPDDVAIMKLTSGSSGISKNVMQSHFNLVAQAYQIEEFFGESPDKPDDALVVRKGKERYGVALPLSHTFSMTVNVISAMKFGAELCIIPDARKIAEVMDTIEKKKITVLAAAPKLQMAIAEHQNVSCHNFNSLRIVISGGSSLSEGVHQSFEEATRVENITINGYGLTEFTPVGTANPLYGVPRNILSVGLPLPRTRVKIVDEENPERILKTGEIGEVMMTGPQLMLGYYNNPGETAKMIVNGWLRTGDIGHMNESYNTTIVGRKGRRLNINGKNVYPEDIERAIEAHSSVAECVVVNLPDDRSQEAAKAIVRLKPGLEGSISEHQMRQYLKERVAPIQVPKHIDFVTEKLPVNPRTKKPNWNQLQTEEREKYDREHATTGADNSKQPRPV